MYVKDIIHSLFLAIPGQYQSFSYPASYHYQTAQQPQYSGTTSGQYGKAKL